MKNKFDFQPKLFTALRNYSKERFMTDLMAGIIVGDFSLRFPSAPIFRFGMQKRKLEGYLGGMQDKTLLCLGTKRKESQG